jgi:hypothetical protein
VRIARSDAYNPHAFEPVTAVALVGTHSEGVIRATGSAFRFGHDRVLLTARHCVGPLELAVRFQRVGVSVVERVIEHPDADIAALVLRGAPDATRTRQAFGEISRVGFGGDEFMSYGFPTEGPSYDAAAETPIPRVFVGHYQRFLEYASSGSLPYRAGELSITAPAGLSGAPLFRRHNPAGVTALVTANVETYAVVDSLDEVEADGRRSRVESRRVLSYGIALLLVGVREWIHDGIPWREVGGIDPPRSLTMVT